MKFEDGKKDVYEEVFNSFDVDHNGYLSVRELGNHYPLIHFNDYSIDLQIDWLYWSGFSIAKI